MALTTVTKSTPTGDVDGVNDTFSVGTAYVSGSLQIWLNGQVISDFVEMGGVFFRLNNPPKNGDTLAAFYRESL